jgi:hypothetical protein
MPSLVQIVPKNTFPHEETYINDNTSGALSDVSSSTVVYPYLSVFAAERGIDRKFVKITSSKNWTAMFGKTNYRKYGQAHLMPGVILSQSNTVVWSMRVTADDALYANSVLSLWYKEDVENKAFRIKFTTKNITVDSDETTGVAGMTKILGDRDLLIEYAENTDGAAVDGVYQDDEGYTQIPLVLFTAIGRGDYGKNLRWRIVADDDYEKEYGIKVYRFEIIDVTDGATVVNTKIGSMVSSGKVSDTIFINDVIEDASEATLYADIHAYEANFEKLYAAYAAFCAKILENNPTEAVTVPDVDEFDPFYGLAVKQQRVRVTPSEPYITFTQPLDGDVDTEADDYDAAAYTATSLAVVDDIAGNSLAGGSDGAFAGSDTATVQAAVDAAYIKAFTGKFDKMILAPRRVESLALFDANYSMDVKVQLARLGMYRAAGPIYLDTGLTEELGSIDINTMEADFAPLDDLIDEFENFSDTWPVSVNTHWYYIKEAATGKRIAVTSTYFLAGTDASIRANYGEIADRTGDVMTLSGHVKNSLHPAIAENETDLKQELYDARINYFEDVGDDTFIRATQSMYVHSDSELLEEPNVIAIFRLKRILEDEVRVNRNKITTPKLRSEFRDYLVDKYSYMVGTYFETLDIQYKSNAYEQRRNITHVYAAVTFAQRSKITLIEIDVNEREYQADDDDEE